MPRRTSTGISVLLILMACGEQRRETFASGAEARSSETARRGWIPEWLPAGAADVDIRYDLDTNHIWLNFRLDEREAIALQQHLRPVGDQQVREIELRRPRGSVEWPEGIIQQQPANDGALNANIFCGTGPVVPKSTCIAFDRMTDAVYAWIPRDELPGAV